MFVLALDEADEGLSVMAKCCLVAASKASQHIAQYFVDNVSRICFFVCFCFGAIITGQGYER